MNEGETSEGKSIDGAFFKAAKRGIAFGFAMTSLVDGEPYYDLQDDHIPEDVLLDASINFAKSDRTAKVMHQGEKIGEVIFQFPLTSDIAKQVGIETRVTGLLIGMQLNQESFAKVESGELQGFSIGGTLTYAEVEQG